MTALKCDRCNGYFDYISNTKNFIAFGHKNIFGDKTFSTKDICPNCMGLFLKWFEPPDNGKPEDCLVNVGDDDERVNSLYKEAEKISNNAGDTKEV